MGGLKALLRSRKFWLAVAAIGIVIAVNAFGVSENVAANWAEQIVQIIMLLIAAIAGEDIATKLKGKKVGK